jgi:hypothetical protein
MIQRIALYTVLGLVLNAVGAEHNVDLFNTWGFWCILALFWAAETMTRREGYEAGMVFIATLPMDKLEEIKRAIKQLEAKD